MDLLSFEDSRLVFGERYGQVYTVNDDSISQSQGEHGKGVDILFGLEIHADFVIHCPAGGLVDDGGGIDSAKDLPVYGVVFDGDGAHGFI